MRYRIIPHQSLPLCRQFVQELYELCCDEEEYSYGCVPNGELGISLVLGGASFTDEDGTLKQTPYASLYGMIQSIQFHTMKKGYREFNIGFHPHFLSCIMKPGLNAMTARKNNPLMELFPKDSVDRLHEDCLLAKTDMDLLLATEAFLRENLIREIPDERLSHALHLIQHHPECSIDEVSQQLNVSSTTLRTLFRHQIGLSPKETSRLFRIKKALKTGNASEEKLAGLALDLGYYDEAHFHHDFKAAIGMSPGKYFRNESLTFDFYNFGRWSATSFESV